MSEYKKGRIESSRSLTNKQSEDARIRKYLSNLYACPLTLDEDAKPHDMDYAFVLDEPARVAEVRRKGYTPVPQERHPERYIESVPWRKNPMEGYISHRDVFLCERPKVYGKIEREADHKRNVQSLNSIPGQDNRMNDHLMPTRVFHNETSIQKMASFKED